MVIAERRAARDGAYIESIGSYNPRLEPAQLRLDLERVEYWLGQGAEPSTTVHSLILKARKGGDAKVALITAEPVVAAAAVPTAEPEAPAAEELSIEVEPEPTPSDPEEAKATRKSKSAGRARKAKAEAEPEASAAEAEEKE